ncbi:hypothetical protein QJS10_CPA06g01931 [Acorus calamus]|uniref:Uncharacterized protein n=1 Tax=Acorus calamus TaxID=4465 RepID=A0AAV9EIQ4_ACOCL|nr:hypothetical protein QJS10_CPB19g00671 [Acorus calamus]KAK1297196.1 hypothetical protein QJS10_CPB15g01748 [Acorus calamus]KAK1313322.1 hypothetical protein QJS10_CPA06g01931 [Acorus calamus]
MSSSQTEETEFLDDHSTPLLTTSSNYTYRIFGLHKHLSVNVDTGHIDQI